MPDRPAAFSLSGQNPAAAFQRMLMVLAGIAYRKAVGNQNRRMFCPNPATRSPPPGPIGQSFGSSEKQTIPPRHPDSLRL
jgi:hypothetical protein